MSSEVNQPNAEGYKESVVKPKTEADFLAARLARYTPKAQSEAAKPSEQPEAKSESKPEAETKKPEASQEQPKVDEQKQKEVLSKDVDELTDEDIAELAQRGKSGLLKRLAELTAKRKMAEERAAAMEAMLHQAKQQLPEPKVENNPYQAIDDLPTLQAKNQEVGEVIEWAEDVLFRAENLAADDVAVVVDGKEYTKADVRESLRKARKARDKFLPAQLAELNAKAQRAQMEQAFQHQARKELPWLDGQDNDTRKNFEAMVKDPRLKRVKESVPELAPQIEYLIAHAANSIFGRKTIESYAESKPRTPTLNPPETPSSTAAAAERPESRGDKAEKEIESRFRKSGKPDDFIALRAVQISKRQKK